MKLDPDSWFICVETASLMVGPQPWDFVTVREGERRRAAHLREEVEGALEPYEERLAQLTDDLERRLEEFDP